MKVRKEYIMNSYEILIPFHSNKLFLTICINSLIETTPENIPITIIANNEDEKEIDISFPQERVRIIKVNHSLYYPLCVNYGMQFINSENVFLIDADTYHLSGWFESITCLYESDTKTGIVGSALLEMTTNRIRDFGLSFSGHNWAQIYKGQELTSPEIKTQNFQAVCTASCLVNKKAFLEIGGFSEYCNISYSDIDLCIRLAEKGYRIMGCAESLAYHRGNASQRIDPLLKKDCYAMFMAKVFDKMKIDINIFLKHSYERFSKRHKISAQYIMLNLSSLNNHIWFKTQIEEIMKTNIIEIYQYTSSVRDETEINLMTRIHTDIYRNNYPFVYFVDLFSSLENNHFWRKLRADNIMYDIVVDRHGTVRNFLEVIKSVGNNT